jgi:hypothetical protein
MPELRQLNQRIAMRCTIPPLTRAGTRNYIRSRLQAAGARDMAIFTDPALERIAECAGGIPRVVNTLCDHCLLIGYADQVRRISAGMVDEAVSYLEAGRQPRRRGRARARMRFMTPVRWALLGIVSALAAGIGSLAVTRPDALAQILDMGRTYLGQ